MAEHRTPLTQWHTDRGAKMATFAGWLMPIQYEGILAEHKHTRGYASLFDICHMGEFRIQGPGSDAALSRAASHNLATLATGRCQYGFLLNTAGNVLDDCIIYRFGEEDFMVVVNAARTANDFAVLRERLPHTVSLEDISETTAKIDLQGPKSIHALENALKENFHDLPYFAFRKTTFNVAPLLVSRTGYTGELGVELYCAAHNALPLWETLLADSRVKPGGLGARDTLRLEAGLPLYGHELDETHNPTEAGMERMLTSEADYVGREGARTLRECLVPLRVEGRRAARNGDIVALQNGAGVGRVTSGSFAPSCDCVIALAWVKATHASEQNFIIRAARNKLQARRTDIPFYKDGTARAKLT
ncbi:MAG: glycine cleavage system aminomethyltransferase GcvT [Desulfovibrio sp.]|nr:glycine cleavage system aminomethyltransferase GcvT [Desulfovibrio sp.]